METLGLIAGDLNPSIHSLDKQTKKSSGFSENEAPMKREKGQRYRIRPSRETETLTGGRPDPPPPLPHARRNRMKSVDVPLAVKMETHLLVCLFVVRLTRNSKVLLAKSTR